MNENLKKYGVYYLICIFFAINIIFLAIIWMKWDEAAPNKYKVEVSLPVINWQNYSDLAKQYSNGKLK